MEVPVEMAMPGQPVYSEQIDSVMRSSNQSSKSNPYSFPKQIPIPDPIADLLA